MEKGFKKGESSYTKLNDREWLYQKYWGERLSTIEIANIIGCSYSTVRLALIRQNVPIRTLSEAMEGNDYRLGKTNSEEHKKKTSKTLRGEGRPYYGNTKIRDKKWLYQKYWIEKLSCEAIGDIEGYCAPVVGKALKHFNIPRRTLSELGKIRFTEEYKRKLFKAQKFHFTKIELILKEIVEKTGKIKYTGDHSFWIKTPEGNINPDFVVIGKKIAIEANGEYYHSQLHNYKLKKGRAPNERRKMLEKVRWKLIVFWGTDLLRKDAEKFVLSVLQKEKII